MGCMHHQCAQCDWWECDNRQWNACPKCGSVVNTAFDEEGEPNEDGEAEEEDRSL